MTGLDLNDTWRFTCITLSAAFVLFLALESSSGVCVPAHWRVAIIAAWGLLLVVALDAFD